MKKVKKIITGIFILILLLIPIKVNAVIYDESVGLFATSSTPTPPTPAPTVAPAPAPPPTTVTPPPSTATPKTTPATQTPIPTPGKLQPPNTTVTPTPPTPSPVASGGTDSSYSGSNAGGIVDTAEDFLNRGASSQSPTINFDKLAPTFVEVGQLLTGIGIMVLVGAILVLGIKFIMANPEQRAGLQKQLIGLIISAVVIIGAYTIWSISINVLSDLTETSETSEDGRRTWSMVKVKQ